MTSDAPELVVVLAAGQGSRMRSATPKVLFSIAGRTLVGHVLAAAAPLGAARTRVVVGHGREAVEAHLRESHSGVEPVFQPVQGGTGQAVRLALEDTDLADDATVLVLAGDTPLLTTSTLRTLIGVRRESGAAAVVLTALLDTPFGYGRVLRENDGSVTRIVEERDATPEQRAVREVNTGVFAFAAGPLRTALGRLRTDNAQGEEYLTDALADLVGQGKPVRATTLGDAGEAAGINDRVQLAAAGAAMRLRLLEGHMRNGVTVVDPATTWVEVDVTLESDVVIHPGTSLAGATVVERGAEIGPHANLRDTVVRAGATVNASTCIGAEIGADAKVGPYSYLRPGTRTGRRSKVGAYVETKSVILGDDAKVPHLSYVGDATIGARSNIGAGTIFGNYDGVNKHRTSIGSDVRIGSNNTLLAPVSVADNAYTAGGSAITDDVPAGALGVARGRQRNVEGWVARKRPAPVDPE